MSALVNYYGPGLTPTVLQIAADSVAVIVGLTPVDLLLPGTTEVVVAGALLTETPTEGAAVLIPESLQAPVGFLSDPPKFSILDERHLQPDISDSSTGAAAPAEPAAVEAAAAEAEAPTPTESPKKKK